MGSESSVFGGKSDGLGKSASVVVVNLVDVLQESLLDLSLGLGERARQVGDQVLSFGLGEYLSPESSWLLVGSIRMYKGIPSGLSNKLLFFPGVLRILLGSVQSVWLVVGSTAEVSVDSGGTISQVVGDSSSVWAVDWDLIIVLS